MNPLLLPTQMPIFGFTTTLDRDPRVEVHEDVLFVPGLHGGLFDRGRRLIAGSGYYRGLPGRYGMTDLIHGSYVSPIDPDMITEVSKEPVVYAGLFLVHFGHWLAGSLGRFWNPQLRGATQLVQNGHDLVENLSPPYVSACLRALEMPTSRFISPSRPIRYERVVVPYPSFEENNLAHAAYGRLCAEIGDTLCRDRPAQKLSAPLFVTRAALKSGIARISNEEILCEELNRRGFDIVSPEILPFEDQIDLFRSRSALAGFIGSAMMLSAFSPGCKPTVVVNPEGMQSNQILIDKSCGNSTTYLYDRSYFDIEKNLVEGFSEIQYRIVDTKRVADDIMRSLDNSEAAQP